MQLMLILEITFLNTSNGFKLPSFLVSILIVLYAFFASAYFNLVSITDFILSKLRYLIFTESKLLSLLSDSFVQSSSYYSMSCTGILPHGDLWPCLCLWVLQHMVLKWFIFLCLLHFLTYARHSLCTCPVTQYLQFSTNFFSLTSSLCCLL